MCTMSSRSLIEPTFWAYEIFFWLNFNGSQLIASDLLFKDHRISKRIITSDKGVIMESLLREICLDLVCFW